MLGGGGGGLRPLGRKLDLESDAGGPEETNYRCHYYYYCCYYYNFYCYC